MNKIKGFAVEKIILPIGNDAFNSEGLRGTTTKGTPQLDNAEYQAVFRRFWLMQIKTINYLRKFAPVEVIIVQGNHDTERMFYLGELLSVAFDKVSNVSVDNSFYSRKYSKYGNNLFMFTHGDKEKTYNLPLIMATERSKDFGRCDHREVLCGHFHKEMINEFRGIKIRYLPSMAPLSSWERQAGYSHKRCAQALIYSHSKGFTGLAQHNI